MVESDMLTTEEVLLLENLTYFNNIEGKSFVDASNEGMTVGQWLETINVGGLDDTNVYGSAMNGADWKATFSAIQANDELMDIRIAETYTDNTADGGGGRSVLFVNDSTGEAVVAFRGTASGEWKDNFLGGGTTDAADGVSTAQQENALEWYDSIYEEYGLENYMVTVTGHSKGGNKAKYITLLSENEVDRCLSFDGQGFSDEFYEMYADEILARQDLIENHNAEGDFVNILLNDVGETYFYDGCNVDSFAENHAPNSLFQVDENGNVTMTISADGQSEDMAILDDFLNSYLRSMDGDDKAEALELVGEIVEGLFNGDDINDVVDTILDGDNGDQAAYLLTYLLEYERENPELMGAVENILTDLGKEDALKIVDIVKTIGQSDFGVNTVGWLGEHFRDWVVDGLADLIEDKWGIKLTNDELRQLAALVGEMDEIREYIEIQDGSDQSLSNEPSVFENIANAAKEAIDGVVDNLTDIANGIVSALGLQAFEVSPTEMDKAIANLREAHNRLSTASKKLPEEVSGLGVAGKFINNALDRIEEEIRQESAECNELANCLDRIKNVYVQNESKLAAI